MINYCQPTIESFIPPQPAPAEDGAQILAHADQYLESGLVADAAEIYSSRLETEDAPRAHMGLAWCAFRRRDLHEALAHLQELVRLNPDYPDVFNNLGVVLYEMGMTTEAERQFKRAAAANPANTQPWRNLMDLAVQNGDIAACIRYGEQILTIDPDDAEARQILEQAQAQQASAQQPSAQQPGAPQADAAQPGTPPASTATASPAGEAVFATKIGAPQEATPEQATPPQVTCGEIQGVTVVPLTAHVDDRGYLVEVLRATDDHFTKFGQIYLVGDVKAGTIRAFHKHEELWDWFFISHGTAKFVLEDDRPKSPTYRQIKTIVTGERNPALVVVPPGVYHGWMALTDDTQLISTASEVYNRQQPDEVRIPPDSFGDVWSVKGR